MAKVKIFSRFDVPQVKGFVCGAGLTQQHFKDECDINWIIRHYNGQTPPPAVYGDVSMFNGLQDAIDMVDSANEAFMALPSSVRDDFGHDPAAFFAFANNPENKEYLYDKGLAVRPQKSQNVENPVNTPTPSTSAENGTSSS